MTPAEEKRITINAWVAVVTLALGWILTFLSFFTEPKGSVHDSVLWVLGQSFFFAGGLLGLTSYVDYAIAKYNKK